jgi:hypothetical protein
MDLIVSAPPVVGDRRTVTDIWTVDYVFANGDNCVVDYLQLRGHPEKDYFIAINFKPVDGEFERLQRLVTKIDTYDLGGGLVVPRYPVREDA